MRQDVLEALAYVCQKNGITPSHIKFMDTILRVCCTKFGISPRASRDYAQTLTIAYKTDQWKSILHEETESDEVKPVSVPLRVYSVEGNKPTIKEILASIKPSHEPILRMPRREPPPQEPERPKQEEPKPDVREVMATLKPSGEPVHKMEAQTSKQEDRLSDDAIAQIFYRMAKQDTSPDNVGRILLSEARD